MDQTNHLNAAQLGQTKPCWHIKNILRSSKELSGSSHIDLHIWILVGKYGITRLWKKTTKKIKNNVSKCFFLLMCFWKIESNLIFQRKTLVRFSSMCHILSNSLTRLCNAAMLWHTGLLGDPSAIRRSCAGLLFCFWNSFPAKEMCTFTSVERLKEMRQHADDSGCRDVPFISVYIVFDRFLIICIFAFAGAALVSCAAVWKLHLNLSILLTKSHPNIPATTDWTPLS